jgi:hypothetical protein
MANIFEHVAPSRFREGEVRQWHNSANKFVHPLNLLILSSPQHPYCLSLRYKTVFYNILTDSQIKPIVAWAKLEQWLHSFLLTHIAKSSLLQPSSCAYLICRTFTLDTKCHSLLLWEDFPLWCWLRDFESCGVSMVHTLYQLSPRMNGAVWIARNLVGCELTSHAT